MYVPSTPAMWIEPPPPPPPDGPDIDRCKLLGPTGLVVQASMGAFVLLSLVVKRQLEKRKRSWRIWCWDISKQLVGQAVVHGLNVLISDLVALAGNNNPCSLYFLNVLIDTTFGVAILYFSLKGFTWYFTRRLGLEGFVSGQYGRPPQPIFWWKQLLPYLLSIIIMKILVLLPLTLPRISSMLLRSTDGVLDYFSPRVQVVFVMALFPLVMNVLQVCLVDQVIKAGKDADDPGDDVETGPAAGATGGEYRRVPTTDEDGHDGPDPHINQIGGASRRRISALNVFNESPSKIIPTSPLLSPRPGNISDYGSTSPSPAGSPTKVSMDADGSMTTTGNIWSKLLSRGKKGETTAREQDEDANEVEDEDEEDDHSTLERGDRLSVRGERGRGRGHRSAAPSPESFMVVDDREGVSPISPVNLSINTSATQVPPTSRATFAAVSRLSSSVERRARNTLSPPTSPMIRDTQYQREQREVSMTNVVRED